MRKARRRPHHMQRAGLAAIMLLLVVSGPATSQQALPETLEECDLRVREAPEDHRSYSCYLWVARRNRRWGEAARRLDALLVRNPDNHYARAYLAGIEADLAHDRAEELYRQAADGFASQGNRTAEAHCRFSLSFFLSEMRGRFDDAEAELDRAEEAVMVVSDPLLTATLRTRQALLANQRQDYGRAWRLLRRVESEVFSDGAADLRQIWLSYMAHACWGLGRLEEAMRFYRREAELARELGWAFEEAVPRRNIALMAGLLGLDRELRLKLARAALAVAQEGGNVGMEASCHYDLAFLTDGPEQLEHATRSLAIARELDTVGGIRMGLRALAFALIDADPERSFESMAEAIELSEEYGNLGEVARNLAFRAELRRRSGPRERAVTESFAALDAIEATRNLQPDAMVRARNFGTWSGNYYDVAAFLLGGALEGDPRVPANEEELELALAVMERMRARTLLDELDAARVTEVVAAGGAAAERRREVLQEIARVQRLLLDPELADRDRAAAVDELRQLELAEAELRDHLARIDPAFGAFRQPTLATLGEILAALDDDQALLIFQLAPPDVRKQIKSWLFVVTRAGLRVYPLPGDSRIGPAVRLFSGLRERRDGSERRGAAYLYGELMGQAVDELPAGIDRLIIVPDGILFLLPFDALRPEPRAQPLAARFDITLAPSATTWLRWVTTAVATSNQRALALADPVLEYVSVGEPSLAAPLSDSTFDRALSLGPLPYARQEGHAVERLLRGRTRLLVGEDATEQVLKRVDLTEFGVVHFAAHALVDLDEPYRSAIVLAPGTPNEDGLLQIREIVELELSNQLVVLSACQSATGPVLSGEGVMGLARAFFVAGARTVVSSIWPLRDEDAALLFEGFYRHLAGGRSVAAALAAARRERMREGAPIRAWAGVVVVGDGDLVPFPGGVSRWSRIPIPLIAVLSGLSLATLTGATWIWRRAGRRRRVHADSTVA